MVVANNTGSEQNKKGTAGPFPLPPVPHQQEVDAAQHSVGQVVGAAVVLKLNVQAVLNAHLHLRRQRDRAGRGGGQVEGGKVSPGVRAAAQ